MDSDVADGLIDEAKRLKDQIDLFEAWTLRDEKRTQDELEAQSAQLAK